LLCAFDLFASAAIRFSASFPSFNSTWQAFPRASCQLSWSLHHRLDMRRLALSPDRRLIYRAVVSQASHSMYLL
jgi:hypothetical protein